MLKALPAVAFCAMAARAAWEPVAPRQTGECPHGVSVAERLIRAQEWFGC